MATTIFGWDMSHYDAPSIGTAYNEGVRFVTHKTGGDATDTELPAWWNDVKDEFASGKMLVGAYWVLRPDLTSSATAAADAFLARLDSACPGWRTGPFILQADCEEWYGKSATKPGKAYIKAFCDRLHAKMPKLVPIVYASAGQYGSELTGVGYPLWNARYPYSTTGSVSAEYAKAGGDSGKGWASYSGQVPKIWQFSSTTTIGGQTTSDGNAFKGDLPALIKLLAPGWAKEDNVNVDDLVKDKNAGKADRAVTGPDTELGGLALSQQVWDPTTGKLAPFYIAFNNVGKVMVGQAAQIKMLSDKLDQAVSLLGQLAASPANGDPISQDEVDAAVAKAFKQAFGG